MAKTTNQEEKKEEIKEEEVTTVNIKLPEGITKEKLTKKLQHEKKIAFKYQKRRHAHWTEIYELYRNIVRLNRLTQRQSINIPLMKETIKTILSKIGEAPFIRLQSLSGDLDKEIIVNQLWTNQVEEDMLELQDRVDKKQEQLYGRSHMALNIVDGKIVVSVKDVYELLIDPKTKPYDIDTARFTIETQIFKPLDEVLANEDYDKDARQTLKDSYENNHTTGTKGKSQQYQDEMKAKNERMQSLGIDNLAELEGFDTLVGIDGHITHLWDKTEKKFVKYYVVMANEKVILSAKTLMDVMGIDFMPYEGWADDLELTDYWSDGTGDLILTPNKTLNVWISQHMENRTLRTFGMNFYNSLIEGFEPQTYEPRPGGWYPVPGKPDEVFKKVEVPQLSGTLEDIQFITNIAERASATGAIEKGAVEDVRRTLGEIEIAVGNAAERTNDMAVYYETARKRLVEKWYQLMVANTTDEEEIELYKETPEGRQDKLTVTKDMWADPEGYKVFVGNKSQRLVDKTDEVSRMLAVKASFPNNPPLEKAIQRRMIGIADFTVQEAAAIEEFEAKKIEEAAELGTKVATPGAGGAPAKDPEAQGATEVLDALKSNA